MSDEARASCWFAAGDCLASIAVGAGTAAAIRLVVTPHWDMVLAMVAGMVLGTVVHLVVAVLLTPLIGALEATVPAGLTGMYGGMYFAMRDAMHGEPAPVHQAALIGAVVGLITFVAVSLYHRAIGGVVFDARDEDKR
ncbi:MAG: hypothetical protein ACYC6C_10040 [Coriobacteriia bacterium]